MSHRSWLILLIAAVFMSVAPTLTWLEFSNGSENLNIATALEVRRSGQWGVPTLNTEPRVAKPPLTAWITAASVRPGTAAGMSSPDEGDRAAAVRALAWQARLPFWMSACLTLLAVYQIGQIIGDARLGLVAAAVASSNLMFLRFGRAATTDVQLMLWVTVANAFLAAMLIDGRRWLGAIGAAIAIALAFMSKGPVGLAQTLAPAAAFVAWTWFDARRAARTESTTPGLVDGGGSENGVRISSVGAAQGWRRWIAPALASVAFFIAIALPWYLYVSWNHPEVWQRWQMEVTREGATDLPAGKWYAYVILIPLTVPWVVFFVVGLVVIVARDVPARAADRRAKNMLFALIFLLVPILVMSLFRDRKDRYLLPMLAPVAVVTARAVLEHFETRHTRNRADRAVVAAHWVTLMVIAVGFPVVGAAMLKTVEGGRWYSPGFAAFAALTGAAIVAVGIVIHRRRDAGIVATTVVLMLFVQAVIQYGYRNSDEARSEMKPLAAAIWRQYPDAVVSAAPHRKGHAPPDLAIYLNRPIHRAASPPTTAPADHDQVLIVRQDSRDSEPVPPPPWGALARAPRDSSWWHAFVIPSTGAAPVAPDSTSAPASAAAAPTTGRRHSR